MSSLSRFGIKVYKSNILEGAIYGVACTYALLDKVIANYLKLYSLTPVKFNALMIIKHAGKDKGISQIDIGRKLIVTASNMTRLLDKLEKEAFIERLSLAGDRRVHLVKISKKGSDLLDRAWPGYYKKIQELAELLTQDELRKVAHILHKWCGKISE